MAKNQLALFTAAFIISLDFSGITSAQTTTAEGEQGAYRLHLEGSEVAIYRNETLVTRLLTSNGSKPTLYPLIGPDQVPLTRAYPNEKAREGEAEDHLHHRSVWFTHGEVSGIDFWAEGEGKGKIVQTQMRIVTGDGDFSIHTTNDWQAPDGRVVLTDQRQIRFQDILGLQAIDFQIALQAGDQEVVFGDTKEGSFGIRVNEHMKVDAKEGGRIINSEGDLDGQAWGKPAAWVDYSGPVSAPAEQAVDADAAAASADPTPIYGIAVLNHPSSFAFPTRWHVRTYGLFAANPFGVHHFTGGSPTEGVRLEAGKTIELKYRLLLHRGRAEDAAIAKHWEIYAADADPN